MTIARGVTALIVLAAAVALSPTASAITPGDLPGAANAEQVIIVTSTDYRSTRALLSAYEKSPDGRWVTVVTNVPAYVGARGIVPGAKRRQGTNTTPAGTYAITAGFGRKANPGTSLPYVQVDRDDAWTYNPKVPATYNVFQTAPVSWGVIRQVRRTAVADGPAIQLRRCPRLQPAQWHHHDQFSRNPTH